MKSRNSSQGSTAMSIGAIAERFGLATHVLRHWETVGLLTPARDTAGRRRYSPGDLTRVAVILRAKEAGLGLGTIRSLAATTDPSARRDILRHEAETLRSRIAAAQAALELIECALDCHHQDFTQCPHYRQTITERIGTQAPAHDDESRLAAHHADPGLGTSISTEMTEPVANPRLSMRHD